jgi:hypothetical protein
MNSRQFHSGIVDAGAVQLLSSGRKKIPRRGGEKYHKMK